MTKKSHHFFRKTILRRQHQLTHQATPTSVTPLSPRQLSFLFSVYTSRADKLFIAPATYATDAGETEKVFDKLLHRSAGVSGLQLGVYQKVRKQNRTRCLEAINIPDRTSSRRRTTSYERHSDSFETLTLYKSCTYLLTYLHWPSSSLLSRTLMSTCLM